MITSSELEGLAFDCAALDPIIAQQLDEIIAELRDRGVPPKPLTVLRYAVDIGLPEATAATVAALLDRRLQLEGGANV